MLIQAILYIVGMTSSLWGAYLLAGRLLGYERFSWRIAAAAVVHAWFLLALFQILSLMSAFQSWVAFPALILSGGVIHALSVRDETLKDSLAQDAIALRHGMKRLLTSRWSFAVVLPVILMLGLILRAFVMPPLGWDSLTYHLVKPALWVQQGAYAAMTAPDATGYYAYFASAGEIFWAWPMLAVHGDALLGYASLWATGLSGILLFASARSFGGGDKVSVLFVLAVLTVPAVIVHLTTQYVDTLHASFLLFGFAGTYSGLRSNDAKRLAISVVALSIAAAIKVTTLPYLAIVLGAIVIIMMRRSPDPRQWVMVGGGALLGFVVGSPDYIRAWMDMGSPLYPIGLDLGPLGVLPGNEGFQVVHSGDLWPDAVPMSVVQALGYLFIFTVDGWNHLNFGYAGFVISLIGLVVLIREGVRGPDRMPAIFGATMLLVGLMLYLSPSSGVYRLEVWAPVSGRLFLVQMVILMLAVALYGGKYVHWILLAAIGLNLIQGIPSGWGHADDLALGAMWPTFAVSTLLAGIAMYAFLARGWFRHALTLVLIGLIVLAIPLEGLRSERRYDYYKESARGVDGVFVADPLEPHFASAWPIWQYLDQDTSLTVAVSAGWDGFGHNWYMYPLFGSRLQNSLQYIPVTQSGEVVDYRRTDLLAKGASPENWMKRLAENRIDYLALLVFPPEREWISRWPDAFEPVVASDDSVNILYRLNLPEIERIVSVTQ